MDRSKEDKKLLIEFTGISDEQLKMMLQKTNYEYKKSKKIEKIILEIMYDLGYSKILPINRPLENKYKKLNRLAAIRHIPTKAERIVIEKADIISELQEMSDREAKWIEDHSYLYDVFYDSLEEKDITHESKTDSSEKIEEIRAFYQMIIDSLTTKPKNFKTKRLER